MTERELKSIILESIQRRVQYLNEGAGEYYDEGTLEGVISEVNTRALQYERYADQLRYGIKNITDLCNNIAEEINNVFGTSMSVNDFKNFLYEDEELSFTVFIPVQNFIKGCKNNKGVMDDVNYEVEAGTLPQVTDAYILHAGLYAGWDDEFYFSPEDRNNSVSFNPRRVEKNGMVRCEIEISNAFATWD